MSLRLHTSDGQFVAEVQSPPFRQAPDVVIFGTRVFARRTDGQYYEAFAWAVPGGSS